MSFKVFFLLFLTFSAVVFLVLFLLLQLKKIEKETFFLFGTLIGGLLLFVFSSNLTEQLNFEKASKKEFIEKLSTLSENDEILIKSNSKLIDKMRFLNLLMNVKHLKENHSIYQPCTKISIKSKSTINFKLCRDSNTDTRFMVFIGDKGNMFDIGHIILPIEISNQMN